jgi:hypothetical protein
MLGTRFLTKNHPRTEYQYPAFFSRSLACVINTFLVYTFGSPEHDGWELACSPRYAGPKQNKNIMSRQFRILINNGLRPFGKPPNVHYTTIHLKWGSGARETAIPKFIIVYSR